MPNQDLTKIKANISSMIDQGADEGEIDLYLASESLTAQDLRGARMSPEDEAAYVALAKDPNATSEDLMAFVSGHGFNLTQEDADAFIGAREAAGGRAGDRVDYAQALASEEAPAAPEESTAAAGLPQAPPGGRNSFREDLRAGAGQFLDGVLPGTAATTRGVRDVVANGFNSLFGDETFDPGAAYEEGVRSQKDVQARFAATNPSLSDGLSYGGMVTSLALPGANVAKGTRLSAGMINGGITAAGYGAASGLMNDTGDGRLTNAALGGTFGGILGVGAPVVARGAGWAASSARRNIPFANEAVTAIGNIPNRIRGLPQAPPSAAAAAQGERIIAEQLDGRTPIATGMGTGNVPATPQSVEAEVARRAALGVPAMPADVTEPLRRTTGWALNGSGQATQRARAAIQARQAQQASRVRTHIAEELGPAVDPVQATQDITRRARAAAGPAYDAAYAAATPMQITPELRALMGRPAFRKALPQAAETIENRGGNVHAMGFETLPDGSVTLSPQPTFEAFDRITRTMNKQLPRNALTGRVDLDSDTGGINDAMLSLDGHLREMNPAYGAAKSNFADEMAIRSGMEKGGDIAKLSGPEIAAQTRTMPQHAREAWGVGARTALADTATQAGLKPTANVVQKVRQATGISGAGMAAAPGDAAKLQAIETMTGQPGSMARLDNRLEAENQAFLTSSGAFGNSKTAERLADDENFSGAADPIRKAVTGNWTGIVTDILLRGNPKGVGRFKAGVQDRIAEVLTADNPQSVAEAMAAVARRAQTDGAFRQSLHGMGIAPAKLAALQAAGQDTVAHPTDAPNGGWDDMPPPYYSIAPQAYPKS